MSRFLVMRLWIALLGTAAIAAGQRQSADPLASLLARAAPKYATVSTSADKPTVVGGRITTTLFVDITPNRGMHVYAPGAKDYVPVTLSLSGPKNVRAGTVVYPPSEIYFFEVLNERVPVYQKPFRLTQPVTMTGSTPPTPVVITGSLKYQACDDKVCYSPESVPVSWTVQNIRASSG
jgi:thiol:disulfide interchange protein DsbD